MWSREEPDTPPEETEARIPSLKRRDCSGALPLRFAAWPALEAFWLGEQNVDQFGAPSVRISSQPQSPECAGP